MLMNEVNAMRRKVVSSVRAHSQVEDCKEEVLVIQGGSYGVGSREREASCGPRARLCRVGAKR